MADVPRVAELMDDTVASTLVAVTSPYTQDMARRWIDKHAPGYETSGALSFAVEQRGSGELAGFVGIGGSDTHAGMGYWYGQPYWGRGYATEAGRAVICFAFEELEIQQIAASHLRDNLQSGRALQKMGMKHVRTHPHFVPKWDVYHDKEEYVVTRPDFEQACADDPAAFAYECSDPIEKPTETE